VVPIKNNELGMDERVDITTAFQDFFLAEGYVDLPPRLALTIAIGGYALIRVTTGSKTQQRIQIGWGWDLTNKINKFKQLLAP